MWTFISFCFVYSFSPSFSVLSTCELWQRCFYDRSYELSITDDDFRISNRQRTVWLYFLLVTFDIKVLLLVQSCNWSDTSMKIRLSHVVESYSNTLFQIKSRKGNQSRRSREISLEVENGELNESRGGNEEFENW